MALLAEAEHVAVRMAQLHLAWPPGLVPRRAEHFETLTHADLVYEVKSSTQTESYTP